MNEDKLRGLKFMIIFLSGIVILLIGYIVNDIFFVDEKVILEEVNDTDLLNLDNLGDYKNFDGTYASMKSLSFKSFDGSVYSINLGIDGKVYSDDYSMRKEITNVNNVIDIISVGGSEGMLEDSSCYMLTDNGEVYVYYTYNLAKGIYDAELVDTVSNVDRLISFQYSKKENSSSSWGVLALLEDGSVVKLIEVSG